MLRHARLRLFDTEMGDWRQVSKLILIASKFAKNLLPELAMFASLT